MPRSGDLFLGLDDGEIVRVNPTTGTSQRIKRDYGTIMDLVCDFDEETLLVVTRSATGIHSLLLGQRHSSFDLRVIRQSPAGVAVRLLRLIDNQPSKHFGIVNGDRIEIGRTDNAQAFTTLGMYPFPPASAGIMGLSTAGTPWVLLFSGQELRWRSADSNALFPCPIGPETEPRSTLRQPPLFGSLVRPGSVRVHWFGRGDEYEIPFDFDLPDFSERTPKRIEPSWGSAYASFEAGLSQADRSPLRSRLNQERSAHRLDNLAAAFVEKSGDFLVVESNGSIRHLSRH
jgi:hypothetical protein